MKKIVALVLSLVMVLGLATVAFGASATSKLYVADNTTTTGWDAGTDLGAVAPAKMQKAAAFDFAAGAGNLDYYLVGGDKYVVADKAAASYKLVYGATTIYLNPAEDADLFYSFQASVYTNVTEKDDECGKLQVADDSKTYYVVKNPKGVVVSYWVKADAGMALLVDGKIVTAEFAGDALLGHFWAGNDIDANGVYTSIKCEECGKVATLFANADAAGKDAVYVAEFASWITADANSYAAAPVAGETVESAKTFDAGIAMYVGMSVMAAAGSAVVLKKKD